MSKLAGASLEIRLLGAPRVLLDGVLVRFRSRKVLALLAYLAVEGGSHRRSKLIELLWPDSAPGRGAATLRSTLSRLRESLGSMAHLLKADGDTVWLDLDDTHLVDVRRVGQLANAPMATVDDEIGDVVGGRFLEGFSVSASPEYDDWVARWGTWCAGRTGDLFERSARWAMEAGRLSAAEERVARWAALTPYEDAPVALMVEVLARRGSRSAALEIYDRYVDGLEADLGVEPGDQLVDLVDRVRTGEFGYHNPVEALRDLVERAMDEVAASRPGVAVVYFDQAVDLLDAVDVGEAAEVTADVYAGRGRALELCHRFDDARANYEALADRAGTGHNLGWRLHSLVGLARLHATPTQLTDPSLAQGYAEEAVNLARLLGDREGEAAALWTMQVVAHYSLGDEEAALEHGEKALEVARKVDGSPTLPHVLNDLHWVHASMGDLAAAAGYLDEAIEVWEDVGDEAMLIDSLNGAVLLRTLMGEFPAARDAAGRGSAVARRVNNTWNQLAVNANLALLLREAGEYDQGVSALKASIDMAAQEMPVARPYYQTLLATLLGDLGMTADVISLCDDIERDAGSCPPFWRLPEAVRVARIRADMAAGVVTAAHLEELTSIGADSVGLAHVSVSAPLIAMDGALRLGDFADATDRSTRFRAAAHRASARMGVAEALMMAGRAELGLGSPGVAVETLRSALDLAVDMGADRLTWQIHVHLAHTLAANGDDAGAEAARKAAIAGHSEVRGRVPRGRLRDAFDDTTGAMLEFAA